MDKKVTIYTTSTCQYCKAAKEFFKENNVEYTEKDVGEDADARKEMVEKSGQLGVPVIMIGDEMLVGFNEEKVSDALGL